MVHRLLELAFLIVLTCFDRIILSQSILLNLYKIVLVEYSTTLVSCAKESQGKHTWQNSLPHKYETESFFVLVRLNTLPSL